MISFRISTDIKADRQVVLTLPSEVPIGKAELTVTVSAPPHAGPSMLDLLATLPPGPLLFKTPQEANRYIQQERDAWER